MAKCKACDGTGALDGAVDYDCVGDPLCFVPCHAECPECEGFGDEIPGDDTIGGR